MLLDPIVHMPLGAFAETGEECVNVGVDTIAVAGEESVAGISVHSVTVAEEPLLDEVTLASPLLVYKIAQVCVTSLCECCITHKHLIGQRCVLFDHVHL